MIFRDCRNIFSRRGCSWIVKELLTYLMVKVPLKSAFRGCNIGQGPISTRLTTWSTSLVVVLLKAAPRPWPSTWFLPLYVLRFSHPRVGDASSRQRRCNNHRRSILLSVNRDTVWSFNERPWINGVRNCWKNLVQWYSSCNEISSFGKLGGHVWRLQLRASLTLRTTETIKINFFVFFKD